MFFSQTFSQTTNTFLPEMKLVNSLISGRRSSHEDAAGAGNQTSRRRQQSPSARLAPAMSRDQRETPRGKESVMKTRKHLNTRTHSLGRRAAPALLAVMLAAGGTLARAAETPSQAELEHCLEHAGIEMKLDPRELQLLSAQKFALGRDRHLIALNTEVALGTSAMNPRLYCTVERNGEISTLQSMPRLPLAPAAALVAN